MSMRGDLISKEYQKMVFVKDDNGKEYVCYLKDLKDRNSLTDEEKARCLDASQIVGDSW